MLANDPVILWELVKLNLGHSKVQIKPSPNSYSQEDMRDNMPELIKFTYELKCFKDALEIKEFYPGKNAYEAKAKKEYGNKAYKDGKDLDALYHYSQVSEVSSVNIC